MKNLCLALLCALFSIYLHAQEKTRIKEAGIVFNNLNNFGINFKTGNVKSLWRINTLAIRGNQTTNKADSNEATANSSGINLKFGKEFRKQIADNFNLIIGSDLSIEYNQTTYNLDDKSIANSDNKRETIIYIPGINLVFGFNYSFNNKLIIGAEITPGLEYKMGTEDLYQNNIKTTSDISGFNYGLSSSSALLSIAYRF